MIMHRTVIFYKTIDGKCPVQEFLDSLSAKVAQKVLWTLSLLEDLEIVPSTYLKKLTGADNIWECRVQYASNIYRIFCFFDSHSVVVLTHGLVKKSKKTPQREIERAESYRKDFLGRRKKL
jgi:phage-related protein